jgi:hypothetical protein
VVPPIRVTEALSQAVGGLADAQPALANPVRLAQLAAQVSTRAAASGIGELHHRELPAHRAIALALNAIAAGQKLPPTEIRERVRARFPSLAPLPERSRLDQVIDQSGLGLIYDERERK